MQETSIGITEISSAIHGVSTACQHVLIVSAETNTSVGNFVSLAARLKEVTEQLRVGDAKFDIPAVKAAHLAWRARLENLFHGTVKMKAAEVASHHECDFGKWYHSPAGQALSCYPAFAEVGKHHQAVHSLAREIVELAEARNTVAAKAPLQSFEKTQTALFAALDALHRA